MCIQDLILCAFPHLSCPRYSWFTYSYTILLCRDVVEVGGSANADNSASSPLSIATTMNCQTRYM